MSDPASQDPLLTALHEAGELKLDDCPEYRHARKSRREGNRERIERATERLRATIESLRRINSLVEWFAEQKLALAKENLDSDAFDEIFRMADRQQQRTEQSLPIFLACLTRLERLKIQLTKAVEERRDMQSNIETVRSLVERLRGSHGQQQHQLQYLSNVLTRIEGQMLHGYTPDTEQLQELRRGLESIAAENAAPAPPGDDHLQRAAASVLERHQGKLSAKELRHLRKELAQTSSSPNPTTRWNFWNKLGALERKHAEEFKFDTVAEKKTTKSNRHSINAVWEMLTDLARTSETEQTQEFRSKLDKTLEQTGNHKHKGLSQLKKQIRRLQPLED